MANVIRRSRYPRDKTFEEMTLYERQRWSRTGIAPKVSSKDKIHIRPKDTLKGTTGTTIDTGAKKVKITSSGPTKGEFRYGGTKDLPPKFSRVQPKNAAGDLKDAQAAFAITAKEQQLIQDKKMKQDPKTGKPIPIKKEKKKDKDISIGGPAITGAALLALNKLKSKPAPIVKSTVKPIVKSTVKPIPPVVKPKIKTKVKPKLGTKTPAQAKVRALTRAGVIGADTGPSQAEINKARAEKKRIKLGTKTPAQDKVKRLQAAQRRGADTGPSDADKAKAKAEQKRINKKASYGDPKPKPKPKTVASKAQQNTIKKIAEEGKKAGKSKSTIKAAIKKALPTAGRLAVKVGSRMIPIVGWGLLAYDAYRIGKALSGDKLTGGKDETFGEGVGFKHGGKIARYNTGTQGKTIRARINRGMIKDTSNGNDFVQNIYDT